MQAAPSAAMRIRVGRCMGYMPYLRARLHREIAPEASRVGRSFLATEAAKDHRVWHLPEWAEKEARPPRQMSILGAAVLLPLGVGSLAVHLFAEGEDSKVARSEEEPAAGWQEDVSSVSTASDVSLYPPLELFFLYNFI